jgi:hypothetical protein
MAPTFAAKSGLLQQQQLFDHLVCTRDQCSWDSQAERSRGLKVHRRLKLGRKLDWQIQWFCALQNPINIRRRASEQIYLIDAIGNEPSCTNKVCVGVDCRDATVRR